MTLLSYSSKGRENLLRRYKSEIVEHHHHGMCECVWATPATNVCNKGENCKISLWPQHKGCTVGVGNQMGTWMTLLVSVDSTIIFCKTAALKDPSY
jgi:hypothetical protein